MISIDLQIEGQQSKISSHALLIDIMMLLFQCLLLVQLAYLQIPTLLVLTPLSAYGMPFIVI